MKIKLISIFVFLNGSFLFGPGGAGEDEEWGAKGTGIIQQELSTLAVWTEDKSSNEIVATAEDANNSQRSSERVKTLDALQKEKTTIEKDVVVAHKAYRKAGCPLSKLRSKKDSQDLSPHCRALKKTYFDRRKVNEGLGIELEHLRNVVKSD